MDASETFRQRGAEFPLSPSLHRCLHPFRQAGAGRVFQNPGGRKSAVANLIDSDFVTIDGVLAAKYGLTDHYTGDGFQKVNLPAGLATRRVDYPSRVSRDRDDGQSYLTRHSRLSGEGGLAQ